MAPVSGDVTQLLLDWNRGDPTALDRLLPLVEAELRRLASHYMRGERSDHTLQATALVNEVYLRLVDQQRVEWKNRAHFIGVAARMMRRVLVDHARNYHYAKRGGGARRLALEQAEALSHERPIDLVALDEALDRLAGVDARKARVVELKFFGGLSAEETAEVLGLSAVTVMRDWAMAKAWLRREMVGGG